MLCTLQLVLGIGLGFDNKIYLYLIPNNKLTCEHELYVPLKYFSVKNRSTPSIYVPESETYLRLID